MQIVIGCDNAAVSLKNTIIALLKTKIVEIEYVGCFTSDDQNYYPLVAKRACEKIIESGYTKRGILICSTGIGISIAANKVRGIRCAHCHDTYSAKYTRLHNDANMIAFGQKIIGDGLMLEIVDTFLHTEFEGGRHQRRVDKISAIEEKYSH